MNTADKRILFLDIMRAIAVLMMVQGHTTDTFLGEEYRSFDNSWFNLWVTLRGFTAPIFMFVSGTVFTYLFEKSRLPFSDNPRTRKGFLRFLTLLGIGYLLRFPTFNIFDYSNISEGQWRIFFAVDALHLIGFGLFFILITLFLSEKLNVKPTYLFLTGIILFFFLTIPVRSVDWAGIFPLPIAAYFYRDTGSLFPLFPWAGYVLAGGLLGLYLAENKGIQRTKGFAAKLLITGASVVTAGYIYHIIENSYFTQSSFWRMDIPLMLFRLGIVVMLNGMIAFLSMELNSIPKILIQIGKNTLLIYVVHLVILYGSAWNPGLYKNYSHSFSVGSTVVAVLIIISAMILMVYVKEKVKFSKKNKNVS